MKKFFTVLFLIFSLYANAQLNIFNYVQYLRITPDARAGAMGDAGIATSPDVYSIYWNTSKLPFAQNNFGIGISYNSWIPEYISGSYQFQATSYLKLDSMSVVTASFRYVSFGDINFSNASGSFVQDYKPFGYNFHGGYARKLSKSFSLGLNIGLARSDLLASNMMGGFMVNTSVSALGDASLFYTHPLKTKCIFKGYNLGLALSNLGTKGYYGLSDTTKSFPPTNIGAGSSFNFQFCRRNQISFVFDLNKAFTSQVYYGFSEREQDEISYSSGIEYIYNNLLFLRTGYFYQNRPYGNPYLTVGAGIKLNPFQLDFSYLIPVTYTRNPIYNTFHLSLSFFI